MPASIFTPELRTLFRRGGIALLISLQKIYKFLYQCRVETDRDSERPELSLRLHFGNLLFVLLELSPELLDVLHLVLLHLTARQLVTRCANVDCVTN